MRQHPFSLDTLRAAYELLVTTRPFNGWNMPDGDEIKFEIMRHRKHRAHVKIDGKGRCTVRVSVSSIGTLDSLLPAMAHEMIHIHEANVGTHRNDVMHTAAFTEWAAEVCRIHSWDFAAFT